MTVARSGHFRINIFCSNNFLFIVIMCNGFPGYYKASTNLYCFCSQHNRSCKSSAISNTPCRNNRNFYRIHHLRHKSHCSSRSDMPAGLHTFRHDCIRSGPFHDLCHRHAGNNRNDLHTGLFPHRHIFPRITCAGSHYFDALFYNNLCNGICFRIHQHQIYTKWFVRYFFYLADLFSDKFSRCTACTDQSQSAGF